MTLLKPDFILPAFKQKLVFHYTSSCNTVFNILEKIEIIFYNLNFLIYSRYSLVGRAPDL
jgi:hypothetical protein